MSRQKTLVETYMDGFRHGDHGAVVAIGEGRAAHRTQGEFRFAFSDVFTFRDNLIERVESYLTPLGQAAR